MVRPVSFKGFQKGFQGVSLRGFRGFQFFLWELCVCIKYLSLGDVGCGTGSVLSFIGGQRKIRGFGLDVSGNMIRLAKEKNPDFDFVTGDCAALPYADESMDAVMACMAYHHFPDQEQFRKEVLRVLKPGGSLYISDPRFPWIARGILNVCFREAGFHTTKKNAADFEKTGFRMVRITKDFYVHVLHLVKEK